MELINALNNYTYKTSLGELRLINKSLLSGEINYYTLKYLDLIVQIKHCTVTKLATVLGISKPAVTMKINELIGDGLVLKEQSPTDKRVHYLTIEPETAKMYRMYDDRLYQAALDAEKKYSKQELHSFCTILADLVSYITWDELVEN